MERMGHECAKTCDLCTSDNLWNCFHVVLYDIFEIVSTNSPLNVLFGLDTMIVRKTKNSWEKVAKNHVDFVLVKVTISLFVIFCVFFFLIFHSNFYPLNSSGEDFKKNDTSESRKLMMSTKVLLL